MDNDQNKVEKLRYVGQPGDLDNDLKIAIVQFNQAKDKITQLNSGLNQSINIQIASIRDEFAAALNVARGEASESQLQFQKELSNFVDEAKERVDAFKRAKLELSTIFEVTELWKNKSDVHKAAARNGSIAFVIISIVAFLYMYYFIDNSQIYPNGANTWLITAKGIAPLILMAWMLKLVSRYINQNLLLMDDARVRSAVADTFIGLVAEDITEMNKTERSLALNALFRAPGGGNDIDVDPPNWLDLIKGAK